MSKYSVEVKPAARKELEALPDAVLGRMIRKLERNVVCHCIRYKEITN